MKWTFNCITVFFVFCFSSCANDTGKESAASSSDAICIWDKASLLEKPEKNGKWLSSVSLGEKLVFLKDKEEEEINGKKKTYLKVRLLDGKEGWIREDMVALGARVAVITGKTDIYNRPDLSTITKKSFEPKDIIAITGTQDDWTEVKGKRKAGNWVETGWIKNKSISNSDRDVAAALYLNRALSIKNKSEKLDALKAISENSDLNGSFFQDEIDEIIASLTMPEPMPDTSVTNEEEISTE